MEANSQISSANLTLFPFSSLLKYIDTEYAGNGVGEYSYYDRQNDVWVDSACEYADSTRCVKMDCHLADTNFKLLGFFKEPYWDEWMEQLFKHEGVCLWDDDEYEMMQTDRETWPYGCTATEYTDESSGKTLYYDLKPEQYGEVSIGLYTDTSCIVEYTGLYTAENVVSDLPCEEDLAAWNDAFDVFKICQPCKAYPFTTILSMYDYNSSSSYGTRKLDDGLNCNDDAGYTNVNQVRFKKIPSHLGTILLWWCLTHVFFLLPVVDFAVYEVPNPHQDDDSSLQGCRACR
jgi:hypothetical protein